MALQVLALDDIRSKLALDTGNKAASMQLERKKDKKEWED